jgi:hypothetical protein
MANVRPLLPQRRAMTHASYEDPGSSASNSYALRALHGHRIANSALAVGREDEQSSSMFDIHT